MMEVPTGTRSNLDAGLARIISLRANSRIADALSATRALLEDFPKSGRVFEELGRCLEASGQNGLAFEAYRNAVDCNDTLSEAWGRLASMHLAQGRAAEANEALLCIARLAKLPSELACASSLLNEGDVDGAEESARAYLRIHGPHPDGMRILAQAAMKLNVLDDAEMLLENVLEMEPDYDAARFEFATVLLERRHYLRALHETRRLLARSPDNALFQLLYASICEGLGEADEALKVYEHRWQIDRTQSELLVSMGHALKIKGDTAGAVRLFQEAARAPKTLPSASLALANTKTYRFSEGEISAMREAESASGTGLVDRYQLCFALGKALEDQNAFAQSFEFYARGNALKRSETKSEPQIVLQTMLRQEQVCTRAFFGARRGYGCARSDPIFILGMPRAGSTLLEQILASHSLIDGTQELPDIPRLAAQFRNRDRSGPPRYPAILEELSADDFALLGEKYLNDTRVFRKSAPYFIDKMPSNFRDIGLIHLILPNARIIDARREPMACCFGNFKQLFNKGMEFNYSLEEIGNYYCSYVRLMAHWDQALPGKILRVQHEDVVNDLEGSVRRIFDFLKISFEPACLDFHKTVRAVRTVSAEQVRRPIYREGLNQWKQFEPWLEPLKRALAPVMGNR